LDGKQGIFVAAQNCSANKNGAYTGDVSAEMLQSMGIRYVVIGHIERREYNHEDNALLSKKINIAMDHHL
jgi:triosephosphate isomerase